MPQFLRSHQPPDLRLLVALVASFTFAGAAQAGAATINVPADHATIQAAITAAGTNDTVNVAAGTYNEDVVLSQDITLQGAGAGASIISGPIGGGGSTVQITASGATLDGFTITRDGNNTTDWNNAGLNSGGVTIQGLSIAGVTIQGNTITGMRTGIDINSSGSHSILDNVIDDNRTGLIFRNQTDNMTVTGNKITDNWTVGVLFLDASVGSNVPVQTAANSTFSANDISGNWYGQVVDRQTGGSLPAAGSNLKNFSGNWYGTTSPVVSTANSSEPGYAAQIPVAFGGSAVPPGGQPDILGTASANIDFSPILGSGTDSSGASGFQPVHTTVHVTAAGAQSASTSRVQEGVNLASTGGTVDVGAGTFVEQVNITEDLTLRGAGATTIVRAPASPANTYSINTIARRPVIYATGATVAIEDLKVDGNAVGSAVNSQLVGIAYNDAAGLIDNVDIVDVRDNPLSGSQGGVGLYAFANSGTPRALEVSNSRINGYNKNGMAVGGGNMAANIHDNVVTGGGPLGLGLAAQNGIQVGFSNVTTTGATIAGNTVTANDYSGAWAGGGILLVKSAGADVSGNDVSANTANISLTYGDDNTVTGNTIGEGDYGVLAQDSGDLTVTGNAITGVHADESFGVFSYTYYVATNASLTMTGNNVSDWDYGVYIAQYNPGTGLIPSTLLRNRIVDNDTDGLVSEGNEAPVDAINNWWGCNTGPNTGSCDAVDAVAGAAAIDTDPWLTLTATAALEEILPGQESALTASVGKNSDGQTIANAIPAATVAFSSAPAGPGVATGSFSPASATTSGGDAGSTWTSDGSEGAATLTATLDGQSASDTVDVTAAAPEGEAEVVPPNPPAPVEVTTGDETTVDANNPVNGSVEVPAGGNGGVISIQEIPSNTVPPADQPTGFAVTGTSFVIHAPDQTTSNPLKFTFVVNKAFDSALDDPDVEVFRNGAPVANCTASLLDDPATPDPCVDSRTRLSPSTLQIRVYSSQASFWVVGGTTPDAIIESGPGLTPANYYTNDNTPTFAYHGEDSANPGTKVDADFECAIDGGAGTACGNSSGPAFVPASFTAAPALSDGVHTFHVQANDGFLSAGNITDQEFFVDTVAPDHTGFTTGPGFANAPSHLSNATSGTITWTRSDAAPSSGYADTQCNLDGAGFVDCTTGTTQVLPGSGLTQGPHSLVVQVVDSAGNVDATPATYSYQIDIVAPATTILTEDPAVSPSNEPDASFTFSGTDNEPGQLPQPPSTPLTFKCRLDTPAGIGAWTPCASGITYPGPLVDGSHTFNVRSVDTAANTDATPDTYTWMVDRTLPVITLRYPRPGGWYSLYKDVESDWDCTDTAPGVVVGTTSTVPEGQAIPRGSLGTKNFAITCTDNAGNVATSNTTYEIKEFHEIVNRGSILAYYRLNEPSGDDTLIDFSGNNHDGGFKNATASEPFGISGDNDTARAFLGEGGYGYVNGIHAPNFSHTLGGWVRFTDTGDAEILDHGYEAGIYLKNQRFVYRMMGVTVTDPGPAVVANQWYFVAGVWTGGQMQLWRTTGAPGITTLPTIVATGAQANRPSSRSTFYIGYGQDVPWLRGAMDEVFYYDSALSTHHINELWLADPPAEPKGGLAASAPASGTPATHSAGSTLSVASTGTSTAVTKAKAQLKRVAKSLAAAKKSLAKLKRQIAPSARIKAATAKVKRLQSQLRRAKARVRSLA